MYNSDLEELIAFYQEEKENLERLIKECVAEMDYQLAEYHFRALKKVNAKLQTLLNLQDPNYDEKGVYQRQLSFLEKKLSESDIIDPNSYIIKRINEIKEKLLKYEQALQNPEAESAGLDNLLYDLSEGLIKGFKFHLNKQENLYLVFTKNITGFIVISFTPFNELEYDRYFYEKGFKALGFYVNEKNNCFQFEYAVRKNSDIRFIKTITARLIFDKFYFKTLDSNTTIEIF